MRLLVSVCSLTIKNYSTFKQVRPFLSCRTIKTNQINYTKMVHKYQTIERGVPNSLDYRVFISKYLSIYIIQYLLILAGYVDVNTVYSYVNLSTHTLWTID